MTEQELLRIHPVVIRNHPLGIMMAGAAGLAGIGFLFSPETPVPGIALIAVPVISMLSWWFGSIGVPVTLTPTRTMVRRGILSKRTNEVRHVDVRNTTISQGLFDRIFGVGTIEISSAGHGGVELSVSWIRDPERIRDLIDQHRD